MIKSKITTKLVLNIAHYNNLLSKTIYIKMRRIFTLFNAKKVKITQHLGKKTPKVQLIKILK